MYRQISAPSTSSSGRNISINLLQPGRSASIGDTPSPYDNEALVKEQESSLAKFFENFTNKQSWLDEIRSEVEKSELNISKKMTTKRGEQICQSQSNVSLSINHTN